MSCLLGEMVREHQAPRAGLRRDQLVLLAGPDSVTHSLWSHRDNRPRVRVDLRAQPGLLVARSELRMTDAVGVGQCQQPHAHPQWGRDALARDPPQLCLRQGQKRRARREVESPIGHSRPRPTGSRRRPVQTLRVPPWGASRVATAPQSTQSKPSRWPSVRPSGVILCLSMLIPPACLSTGPRRPGGNADARRPSDPVAQLSCGCCRSMPS